MICRAIAFIKYRIRQEIRRITNLARSFVNLLGCIWAGANAIVAFLEGVWVDFVDPPVCAVWNKIHLYASSLVTTWIDWVKTPACASWHDIKALGVSLINMWVDSADNTLCAWRKSGRLSSTIGWGIEERGSQHQIDKVDAYNAVYGVHRLDDAHSTGRIDDEEATFNSYCHRRTISGSSYSGSTASLYHEPLSKDVKGGIKGTMRKYRMRAGSMGEARAG